MLASKSLHADHIAKCYERKIAELDEVKNRAKSSRDLLVQKGQRFFDGIKNCCDSCKDKFEKMDEDGELEDTAFKFMLA